MVVKRTPKHRKDLVSKIEKPIMEGLKESTLWDIFGRDVARVGVETSVMIVEMALDGQLSTKVMAKQIDHLRKSAALVQTELIEHAKNMSENKQRSLDELKIALESKYEQEKQ